MAACKKIALEEHFLVPGFDDYWKTSVTDVDPAVQSQLHGRLIDFGEQRLGAMDGAGIARSVLSLAGPGVQIERDAPTAVARPAKPTNFSPARSRSGPIAIRVSPICPCRMSTRRPTNWSGALRT